MRIFGLIFLFVSALHAEFSLQTLSMSPRIYVIPDFLSEAECDYIVQAAHPHLQRSTVLDDHATTGGGVVDSRRSSQGMFFPSNPQDPVLRSIDLRISKLRNLPVANGEAMQVLAYQMGAEYQPHFDYFPSDTPGGAAQLKRGGQRVATVIMYLNTPEAGGETIFPTVNISVTPNKGTALL
jgi:prolyl 4-hydroxylase